MTHPIIIIGTGLAGYQLAREFRKLDHTSPLLLITSDDGKFYSKPQLSIALTSGKSPKDIPTATVEQMSDQLKAEIKTNTFVTAIDPNTKTVTTGKDQFIYQKLVLACGAEVIKPILTGNAVHKILSINHIYHYAEFRTLLVGKKRITILGAGLIGCEFANDLSNAGYKVDLLAPVKAPLEGLVPEQIGKVLQTAIEKKGATFHLPATAENIQEQKDGTFFLTLSNGAVLETDLVLSAIGLFPHIALAKTAALAVNRGILVDRYLQTSDPDIFALGDCAEVEGHVLPFITPILNCSRALAKTLAGTQTAVDYPAMPIVVKTPAHPITVCPPPKGMSGKWKVEEVDGSYRALFYNAKEELFGFVLTNQCVKERAQWVKLLPPLVGP